MSFPHLLPTYARADVAFVRGEGAYLFDEEGRKYLDFGAGVAVNALGHAHLARDGRQRFNPDLIQI